MADIDQLFATFRAEAGTEIRPPGSDVARRTVRRRRSVRLAATAVLAVAAVVAVGLVARPGPGLVGETPASGPARTLDQRNPLGVEALAQIGYSPTATPDRPDMLPIRPGIVFGGLEASAGYYYYRIGSASEPLPAGMYKLQAVCVGPGRLTVEWYAPPGTRASMTFACAEGVLDALVLVDTSVDLFIAADEDAAGQTGVAVVLTDPHLVAARTALGVPTRTPISEGEAVLYEPLMNVDETPIAAAGYRLLVACAGRGTVEATLAAGPTSQSGSLVCTPAGALTELTVAAPAGASLTVTIEPDATATGQAAVVYRVTKA